MSVSMNWDNFAGLMLTTKAHYEAWLAAKYAKESKTEKRTSQPKLDRVSKPVTESAPEPEYSVEPKYGAVAMF